MKKAPFFLVALGLLASSQALAITRVPEIVAGDGTIQNDLTVNGTITGDLTGNVTGDLTGNADTATSATTAATATALGANPSDCAANQFATTIAANGDLSCSAVPAGTALSGQTPIANGGTGQSTQTAGFDALAPTTTKGDLIVHDGTDNIRVAVGSDGQVLKADSGSASGLAWGPGGGGSGGINYESDPYFQLGVGTWTLHGDSTDLSGGTTTGATFTADSDSTQIFSGDFAGVGILTKDAADRDGVGVAKAYTIPAASRAAGYVYVSGYYSTTTGLSTGDAVLAAYDVTNSALLNLQGMTSGQLVGLSANGVGRFTAKIAISSNTASIRLGPYWNDNTSVAKDLYFSGIEIGPDKLLDAPIMSYLGSITVTLLGDSGTAYSNSTATAQAWRNDDKLVVGGKVVFAGVPATASGAFRLQLPSGYTIDTSKLPAASSANNRMIDGYGSFRDAGTINHRLAVGYQAADAADRIRFIALATTDTYVMPSAPIATIASGDAIDFNFEVPILEWANQSAVISTTEMMNKSSGTEAYLNGAANHTSNGGWQQVVLDAEASDDLSEFTGGSFTAKSAGYRLISSQVGFSALTGAVVIGARVKVGSTVVVQTTTVWAGATTGTARIGMPSKRVWLNVGDVVTLEAIQAESASEAYLTGRENTFLSIQAAPDFSVYGVYGQYEVTEARSTSSLLQSSPSNDTYYAPANTFTVPVTPGTWEISAEGLMYLSLTGASSAVLGVVALSESTTPGSGIIGTARNVGLFGPENAEQGKMYRISEIITTTTAKNIYLHVKGVSFSGSPTITNIGIRGDVGGANMIRAKRIR